MNNRFKELAEQAGLTPNKELEEFARLITRDCQILANTQPTGLTAKNAIQEYFYADQKPKIVKEKGMWFCDMRALIHSRMGSGHSPAEAYGFWKKYNERHY